MQVKLLNFKTYWLLALVALLTLFPQELVTISAKIFSPLKSMDGIHLTLLLYIFQATITILAITALVLGNKTYIEKLGLTFPWKQFKPGWFIIICLLWVLPNTLSTNWQLPTFSLTLIIGIVMAPLIEELIFRGFILGLLPGITLWKWAKLDSGVIVMALIFALWHFDILKPGTIMLVPFLLHFAGGLTLGMLRNQTGGIWLGIIVHALGNFVGLLHGMN